MRYFVVVSSNLVPTASSQQAIQQVWCSNLCKEKKGGEGEIVRGKE
jgi:hypothetical protein